MLVFRCAPDRFKVRYIDIAILKHTERLLYRGRHKIDTLVGYYVLQ